MQTSPGRRYVELLRFCCRTLSTDGAARPFQWQLSAGCGREVWLTNALHGEYSLLYPEDLEHPSFLPVCLRRGGVLSLLLPQLWGSAEQWVLTQVTTINQVTVAWQKPLFLPADICGWTKVRSKEGHPQRSWNRALALWSHSEWRQPPFQKGFWCVRNSLGVGAGWWWRGKEVTGSSLTVGDN